MLWNYQNTKTKHEKEDENVHNPCTILNCEFWPVNHVVLSVVTPCFTFRRGKGSLAPKVAKHPPNLQLDLDLGCTYTEPGTKNRLLSS